MAIDVWKRRANRLALQIALTDLSIAWKELCRTIRLALSGRR
jgi:hypothetical protein